MRADRLWDMLVHKLAVLGEQGGLVCKAQYWMYFVALVA